MSAFLHPEEIYRALSDSGVKKAGASAAKLIVLGVLAGAYIGLAAHLATVISTGHTEWLGAKKFLAGVVFTFGLMIVIIPGSELWTGNNLMTIALFEKRISFASMMRNWFYVYTGNFIGAVLAAAVIGWGSGLLEGAVGGTALKIAMTKVSFAPEHLHHDIAYFFRGIGCNWLVCLAVVMAAAAKDATGKILGIFFPVMAFVASGFEHCIANMYFLTAGIFAKGLQSAVDASGIQPELLSALNWSSIWTDNIITVTLGNTVGGALFVGAAYWWLYVRES